MEDSLPVVPSGCAKRRLKHAVGSETEPVDVESCLSDDGQSSPQWDGIFAIKLDA